MGAPYAGQFLTPGRFAGRVAVVTGAAQGIGQKVAERIGAEGGAVVLVDRAELVHDVARGIVRAAEASGSGGAATSVTADLETWAGAQQAVEAALAAHGRVDVLVNNVGGTIWARPYEEYDEEKIEKEIRRSLFPTLWSCRAVLPAMLEQGSGTIVNVSSVATRGMHRVPYAAAKGGVNALTQSLAMEVAGRGIRVVATAPGGTEAPPRRVKRGPEAESAQERAWYQVIVDQTVDSSFVKRYGTLDEQAAPIVFLASDEASYVTGSVLPVAGGDLG
ncbi:MULTISPECIES: 1,6-dihydroxycyclohexa-2,4-diene-1-carboxylate dehydrogenase [Kocuria]|jgi:dihydroxycyclohexadiene carboxylate dehydrogenase|uniref:1,6-dihydroxycyclohexa-2,4-diene-1-carboxylate dehydrogenase n=1 Tax=Kocuria rosea subsp. polaris TaxID=136273 RepID=A0A0A6VRG6_KOCRO|nr:MULTISPECIES: 1,6-dihydroxycyclohexa-2,4-diene-1-carboxylate dehydrogenase [Kocuria]KHD96933.1 1,6-dihydroxycyclohexa-2,4-diene-1-carboxylate dehydrogenase [Kocuria polaris]PAU91666.1 1,6-dihydroxycyclohexa-2,4-diene-1-carboxylate dehydrogenase [Kocuria sp. WN036]PWF85145.1 1,6-dihydroxycyclohexa-2,4-diene-1-carboxylate dehydrogenase [Kocuria rosea]WIG17989.1 1,6-dihydroxycyclohexa-2,4-diene-1-carboxylate dehydrogenase [Kocuria rosea]STX02992.1 Glucose 1-dehydrogenase 2 [Kocuria rosea]